MERRSCDAPGTPGGSCAGACEEDCQDGAILGLCERNNLGMLWLIPLCCLLEREVEDVRDAVPIAGKAQRGFPEAEQLGGSGS